jgi:XTP/dITP diphosphohydrolase
MMRMMRELVFATNNGHKLKELKSLLEPVFYVKGLREAGLDEEIPEDHFTLEENAFQKAEFVSQRLGVSCFADDTGLEIDALNGEPGVFSARYSRIGDPVYPEMEVSAGNIRKVLEKLKEVQEMQERGARFRTVIALILDGKRYTFEGVVKGTIITEPRGADGFGYDPVFLPEGRELTFAEMDLAQKNEISHRARAVRKLADFLASYNQSSGGR